jgi:oligosaccharide repeat unit polymerase
VNDISDELVFILLYNLLIFSVLSLTVFWMPKRTTAQCIMALKQTKSEVYCILLLNFVGLILCVLYLHLNDLISVDIIYRLAQQRYNMTLGEKPRLFYFFYITELSLILYFLLEKNNVPRTLIIILALLTALNTILLLSTGAKGNIGKSLTLLCFGYLLLGRSNTAKRLLGASFLVFFVLIFIGLLMLITGDKKNVLDVLINIPRRFSSQIAVLDQVLFAKDFKLGLVTFLPFAKTYNALGGNLDLPSHILGFYDIPYPWNIGTYLETFLRDFGLAGIFLAPFFLFVFTFSVFVIARSSRYSVWGRTLLIFSIIIPYSAWFTAPYNKPIYLFQLVLLIIMITFSRLMKR